MLSLPSLLHAAADGVPVRPGGLWHAWSLEPYTLVALAVPAVWYAVAAARGGRAVEIRRTILFALGWLACVVALVSPLDLLGETLFAGHMAQHLMLIAVAAPLMVLGAPPNVWLWAVARRTRRRIGQWWMHARVVRPVVSALVIPSVALLLHTVAIWLWHFPRFYQAALANEGIHVLEHLSFFGTALLFWWVTLHPTGRRTLGHGMAILYVGVTLCSNGALGALLMFSAEPWYPRHAAGEAAWGLTPIADQQLAGLIMWIPAAIVYLIAAAALFLDWMRIAERTAVAVSPTLSSRGA